VNLTAASLALLPVGSVVVVRFGSSPRVLSKIGLSCWGFDCYSDEHVATMKPQLRSVLTTKSPPGPVRTLAGFEPSPRARPARRRTRTDMASTVGSNGSAG
jgi:hypothetical protein